MYNLVYAKSPAKRIGMGEAATNLAETLLELKTTEYQVLALDHQYTDTNFSAGTLKGNDVARVAALRAAAREVGMNIRVGLIEHHESCGWDNAHEFGSGYDYYARRRRSYREEYVERSEPKTFAEVELGEEYESYLTMGKWLAGDGPDLGTLSVDADEILRRPGLEKTEPIEWSVEGYQGNWGMTAEFTYRHAGVILWHPAATGRVLSLLSLQGRMAWAVDYAFRLAKQPEDTSLRKQLLDLEESILAETKLNDRNQVDATKLTKVISPLYDLLLAATIDELKGRLDAPPEPFTDEARSLPSGIKSAGDRYAAFFAFLVHPGERVFDYKKPQGQRDQLSSFVQSYQLDVDESTVRTRPSHTLRLTKNDASYQRALRQREKDRVLFEQLSAHRSAL